METSVQMSISKSGIKIIFLLSMLLPLASDLSAQQILQRSYSAVKGINGRQSLETTNSEFMIAGYDRFDTLQPSNYFTDALIMRTDSMGNVLWNKTYGGIDDDMFNDIIRSQDGNYVSVGYTESYGPYGIEFWDSLKYNIYVVKVDDSGNPIWSRVYGDTLNDFGIEVLEKNNGDLVVLASVNDHYTWDNNSGDVMILCLDSTGGQKWSKVLYSLNGYRLVPQQIVKSHDGGYYVCGEISYLDTTGGWIDAMVIRTDSLGNIIWAKRMNEGITSNICKMVANPTNGVYFAFSTYRYVLAHLDSSGNILWASKYGLISTEHITAMAPCNDGSGLILGGSVSVTKVDTLGNILWSTYYSGQFGNQVHSIIHKLNYGYYLSGFFQNQSIGYISAIHLDSLGTNCQALYYNYPVPSVSLQPQDIFITDSSMWLNLDIGCVLGTIAISDSLYCNTATNVQEISELQLISFHPNPVSDLLYLKYNTTFQEMRIFIYNIQGKMIHKSDLKPENIYLGDIQHGIYYLEVHTENKIEVYKFAKI